MLAEVFEEGAVVGAPGGVAAAVGACHVGGGSAGGAEDEADGGDPWGREHTRGGEALPVTTHTF